MSSPDAWFAVSVTVKSAAAEAVEFAFNCLDSEGTEINDMPRADRDLITVIGYFQNVPAHEIVLSELDKCLSIYNFPADSITDVRTAEVKNQDWLAEWKKHWKPSHVGSFVIAAPWHEVDDVGRMVIRIEPNMAFGTGTHETTQLCLTAIDESYHPGRSFLDVGTGTGILAIAAAKITANSGAKIVACDTDADAVDIARENAELNGVGDRIDFFTGPITDETECFDFVCANLTADVIVPIVPLLIEKTRKTLVLSGILAEQERSVLDGLSSQVKERYSVSRSGEWVSVKVLIG